MNHSLGNLQGSSIEDMSLLYSAPSFRYPEPEFRKNQEMRDFNHYHCLPQNSGLARNQSAPSSFFDNLVIDTSDCGGGDDDGRIGCEDFQYLRSSSPDLDTMLEKFTSSCDALEDSGSHEWQDLGERAEIKQEVADSEMAYRSLSGHDLVNDNSMSVGMSVDRTFGVVHYMNVKNSNSATKMSPPNGSNLLRQNSSPPGLLSNLAVDNGTRVLPQIAEVGNQDMATCSPDPDVRKRRYMDSFANGAWDDTSLNGFKRLKDNDGRAFTGLNMLDDRSVNSKNHVAGLTHHLSLPKTAVEMASIEKYLQFQGSVPCKIRAKRGCATHPRSIAERVRRTRISERIKKLQDLFPNMDKHTNTADMLDLAVEYIKDLQEQVKTLSETKAKCSCSNRQKQY